MFYFMLGSWFTLINDQFKKNVIHAQLLVTVVDYFKMHFIFISKEKEDHEQI